MIIPGDQKAELRRKLAAYLEEICGTTWTAADSDDMADEVITLFEQVLTDPD